MANAPQSQLTTSEKTGVGLSIRRYFTDGQTHPFDAVPWEIRDALIGHGDKVSFEQREVEFPASWSQNATNIVAQKYFRGQLGSPTRERSVKQMIGRVAGTIAGWGAERGYFATDADATTFEHELTHILLHQMAAFNSPVWFNVGFEESPQCSACFILSVRGQHGVDPRLEHQGGQDLPRRFGSGINLSQIRGSHEPLTKGGTASGPVSFMRGADAWAGTIKSGGKTRRAAKMVVLDVDHPDIRDFIWCKAKEEDKAAALRDAGFDMSIDGDGFYSIQYQNANNSVRVSDEFMNAVENDEDWHLLVTRDRASRPANRSRRVELMKEIAEAAWRCADPGVQYDTVINEWHTCPESGRINASNPCSEYMHVDDSACNLASLNLMKFRRADGTFDVESFEHAVDIVFLAQEIIVSPSSYPTEEIGDNARAFRQLGMGYANLGAYLMADGMPYDSDAGRGTAAAITALMTGRGYLGSARIAAAIGAYDRYAENREAHNAVMRKHRDASYAIPREDCRRHRPAGGRARRLGTRRSQAGEQHGYRNAQATVMAPTGTISFLMDCDTTGVEPDFSLVKYKELVGGGQMTIVNRTVPLALQTLGYADEHIEQIIAYVNEHGTIVGAPGLEAEDLPVFDVAVGERAISYLGHIKMMGAIQPFMSGAISKTVNMPEAATVEDIADAYLAGVAAGRQGAGDLPRRIQDRAGAADRRAEGQRRRPSTCRPRSTRPSPRRWRRSARSAGGCRGAPVDHPQVLDRRPRGLHHRRHVRGRHHRRDLPDRHRQGGLDAARDDELVRDRDLDLAAVRGAARDARAQVQLHALRARGHDLQPGDPVLEVDARLHHALAGVAVPRRRPAGGARDPDQGGPLAQGGAGRRELAAGRQRRAGVPGRRRNGQSQPTASAARRGGPGSRR